MCTVAIHHNNHVLPQKFDYECDAHSVLKAVDELQGPGPVYYSI